jgi:hypothetical protein
MKNVITRDSFVTRFKLGNTPRKKLIRDQNKRNCDSELTGTVTVTVMEYFRSSITVNCNCNIIINK